MTKDERMTNVRMTNDRDNHWQFRPSCFVIPLVQVSQLFDDEIRAPRVIGRRDGCAQVERTVEDLTAGRAISRQG
jgi:hypothetical protein